MNESQDTFQIDLKSLTGDGAGEILKALKDVTPEESEFIHRATHRLTEIGVLAIGADSATLTDLQVERNAVIASLLSLLEAKGVDAQHKIESFITGLLYKAIDVVLGRLGL